MKHILLATTALVMTAGVAAAQDVAVATPNISVDGDARMGVIYNGDDWNFTSRARVQFNAAGETDGGLTFGFSFRLNDEGGAVVGGEVQGGEVQPGTGEQDFGFFNTGRYASTGGRGTVFIAGTFGRLAMGAPAGAAEAAVGDLAQVSLTGLGFQNENTYLQGDGADAGNWDPTVLYSYTFGDFTFHASANDGAEDGGLVGRGGNGGNNNFALGGRFAFGDFAVTAGFESVEQDDDDTIRHYIVGAEASFAGFDVKATYGEAENFDLRQLGASVSTQFDLLTVTAFARNLETATVDETYVGLGGRYDLGGGAALVGGIVHGEFGASDDLVGDFGVAFSF